MTNTPSSGGTSGGHEPRQDEETAELNAALGHLREAIDRLRHEIEVNARDEWVRAKPELQSTLGDLQRMIDAAAERAKALLDDLSKRLDRDAKTGQE